MGELPDIRPLQAEDWDRFLESSRPDIGYTQSSWWADFLATRGWEHFGAVFKDGESIVGGARVMRFFHAPDRCSYYIPEGPVLPVGDVDGEPYFKAIVAFVDEKAREDPDAVSHLRIEPRWTELPRFVRGHREAKNWLEPRDTLTIDLTLTDDEILAQMKPKGRYNVRVARRSGVAVVEDRSPRGLEDFLELYRETYTRHGVGRKRSVYFRDMFAKVPADRISLLFAEYEGLRLATALVVHFGGRADYLYGGSRAVHRRTMAPYLLHFEAMRRARARGCRWYDLTGIAPPASPDDAWAGLSAFKRKFGGTELSFVPSLDFIYDPIAYLDYHRPGT